MRLSQNDSVLIRLVAYLNERFPPVAYTMLVVLFWASAAFVSAKQNNQPFPWHSAWIMPVVLFVFLHLRLFDEHKDADVDQKAHPERLLSQGVVTLSLLRRMAVLVICFEACISISLGTEVFLVWLLTFGFTLAMRYEFGIGSWLNRHLFIYAISHNPVVACLGVLCWVATDHAWGRAFAGYLLMVSLGSLVFEMARKIRLPSEEIASVDSYSSVFGRARAVQLLRLVGGAAVCVGFWVLWGLTPPQNNVFLGLGIAFQLCAMFSLVVFSKQGQPASKVEQGGSLFLLLQLISCIVGSLAS